jgi:1,2-diacylglycerol 3-alpha-glucosyltransferase/glucuronosyltransferase
MRIAVVSDAWFPQVNGVVRTLSTVKGELEAMGHSVLVVSPDKFKTVPCPTYPEIRLALLPGRRLRALIDAFAPDALHIATEGPLGWAARSLARQRGWPFTTSFHTKFPEYVAARTGLPASWGYLVLRHFHGAAAAIMVATPSLGQELTARGFKNLRRWTRGVDTALFRPRAKNFLDAPRPIYMFVGRVAVEKNIETFLKLELDGTKYVVGDGPSIASLRQRYPAVRFTGYKAGEELAQHVAAADVFVFPSLTDTFGLVLLEALASGVPVAAFPITGPSDVINGHPVGALDADLGRAARRALGCAADACRAYAMTYSWRASAEQFLGNLRPFR